DHDNLSADADLERDLRPQHDPAEDVATQVVDAEQMLGGRTLVDGRDSFGEVRVWGPELGHDRNQDQQRQKDGAGEREAVATEATPGVTPQARLLVRQRFIDDLLGDAGKGSHQYLIRGSMTVRRGAPPGLPGQRVR